MTVKQDKENSLNNIENYKTNFTNKKMILDITNTSKDSRKNLEEQKEPRNQKKKKKKDNKNKLKKKKEIGLTLT